LSQSIQLSGYSGGPPGSILVFFPERIAEIAKSLSNTTRRVFPVGANRSTTKCQPVVYHGRDDGQRQASSNP
jgi:hypothetical protein